MYLNTEVICFEAKKIPFDIWQYVKSRYPRKYREIKKGIRACGGINKVKIFFAKGLNPVQIVSDLA